MSVLAEEKNSTMPWRRHMGNDAAAFVYWIYVIDYTHKYTAVWRHIHLYIEHQWLVALVFNIVEISGN